MSLRVATRRSWIAFSDGRWLLRASWSEKICQRSLNDWSRTSGTFGVAVIVRVCWIDLRSDRVAGGRSVFDSDFDTEHLFEHVCFLHERPFLEE